MNFLELSDVQRRTVITQASARTGINANLIEKDWWICQVLRALYSLESAGSFSFKGGTSLSKCWHLIDRFSEDIDIGIAREYLGFEGELSKTQISDKLRRAACSFVREKLQYELHDALVNSYSTSSTSPARNTACFSNDLAMSSDVTSPIMALLKKIP